MQRCSDQDIQEHLQLIELVPRSELPDGPARDALVRLAQDGQVVYAYLSDPAGRWRVWVGPMVDAGPWVGAGKVPMGHWVRDWAYYVAWVGEELIRSGQIDGGEAAGRVVQ